VVVVPFTLLQYLLGHAVRVTGVATGNGVVVTTSSWRVGLAGLVTALAGVVMFLVLTGAITQALVVEGRRPTEAMGRSWALVGGHWWHAFGTLIVAGLLTGLVNALITAPFNQTSWFLQAVVAAIATVITLPYGTLVGVLLYLDLRARKEQLTLGAAPSRPPGISHLIEPEAGRTEARSRCLSRLAGPFGRLYRSVADW
jgi:hypothetical protein